MDYRDYQHLTFERRPHGVVLITINRPEVLNATNDRLHWELTRSWLTLDADDDARLAVVTGAGRAFSAGGNLDVVDANARDPKRIERTLREASDIVYNMINLDKPVISAINGVAVGAGLVVAMMADISIMSGEGGFHRRPHQARRRGRRPCRHPLAAPLRDGQGQVLPADLRLHRRQGGRAHRARQ